MIIRYYHNIALIVNVSNGSDMHNWPKCGLTGLRQNKNLTAKPVPISWLCHQIHHHS